MNGVTGKLSDVLGYSRTLTDKHYNIFLSEVINGSHTNYCRLFARTKSIMVFTVGF